MTTYKYVLDTSAVVNAGVEDLRALRDAAANLPQLVIVELLPQLASEAL